MANNTTAPEEMESVINGIVDRFLAWRLPVDFSPDCGISFDGRGKDARGYEKTWPVGTNLFTAEQARVMFEHCLAPAPVPPAAPDVAEIVRRLRRHHDIDCELFGDPTDHTLGCSCSWVERRDTADTITRLAADLARVERERDAAMAALTEYFAALDNSEDPKAVGSTCRLIRAESAAREIIGAVG